jgi:hypothetical protein
MFEIVDDKSQHCIPFLLDRLRVHTERHRGNPNTPPFFIGLNGVQGAGKTVLVSRSRAGQFPMPRDLVHFLGPDSNTNFHRYPLSMIPSARNHTRSRS